MTVSPDIRPALVEAYVATFAKPPPSYLQIVHFSDPEVKRYNFHGIAKAIISMPRNSASLGEIVDLHTLQEPLEEEKKWGPPTSAWVSRYHPESLNILVASGKQPGGRGAQRFDQGRICEGLVINFTYGFEHREIPYEVKLIPIYLPKTG